jgi:hypothetical protein
MKEKLNYFGYFGKNKNTYFIQSESVNTAQFNILAKYC